MWAVKQAVTQPGFRSALFEETFIRDLPFNPELFPTCCVSFASDAESLV